MKKVRIVGRNSQLSLIQARLVKEKLESQHQNLQVEIIGRSSRGDREQQVNLATLEGTDFFTQEIFEALQNEEADIAVHSLKDMSAEHFFSHHAFTVTHRDDVRDIAIFNDNILEKLKEDRTVVIGTCSPRRELMAIRFLTKALPQFGHTAKIKVIPIRGNVESRLRQVDEGKYDGTILATAGLNRLLKYGSSETGSHEVAHLLSNKRLMLLPLLECVPAPCQGAIVAEANPNNSWAISLLQSIGNEKLFAEAQQEKKLGLQYGTGCDKQFGLVTISTPHNQVIYASGIDQNQQAFEHWYGLPELANTPEPLFSATDAMSEFFSHQPLTVRPIETPCVFIAHAKIVTQESSWKTYLQTIESPLFAAGNHTWLALAQQGYWVTACADGLGFESFLETMKMPLFNLNPKDFSILTHEHAAERWQQRGYTAVPVYRLQPIFNQGLIHRIQNAAFVFWTSYAQFNAYHTFCKPDTIHACPGGETARLIQQQGIEPVIFPTINAFKTWRKFATQPTSGE